MNPSEVVVHEVQGYGMLKVFNFFAKSVGQAREPAHPHTHCGIIALYMGSGNLQNIGVTIDAAFVSLYEI